MRRFRKKCGKQGIGSEVNGDTGFLNPEMRMDRILF